MCNIQVSAAEKGIISAGNVTGKAGENVDVEILLESNPGIVSIYLGIGYDTSVLKLNSINNSGLLPDYMAGPLTANPVAVSWELASATENNTSTGKLVTLNFTILDNAKPGDYKITVDQFGNNNPYDVDLNDVEFSYEAGTLTVEATPHEHVWSDWTVIKEADCTKEGQKERICTISGCNEKETETINPLGHEYGDWKTIIEATVSSEGKEEHVCTRCGYIESRVIPKIEHGESDHIFNGRTEVLQEADCTHEGKIRTYCSVKGCNAYRDETISAKGHTLGDWTIVTEATCTADGKEAQYCEICSEKVNERVIAAKGHSYEDWIIVTEPQIGIDGLKTRTCSTCNYVEEQVIPAIIHGEEDHVFDGKSETIEEPTCTLPGVLRIWCSFKGCNAYKDTEIPAKGHLNGDWVIENPATCTESGLKRQYCETCGDIVNEETIQPTGHTSGEWITVEEADCTTAGKREQYCTVCKQKCGEEIIPALGHDYGDWTIIKEATIGKDGLEERTCKKCDAKEERIIPAINHGEAEHVFNGKTEVLKEATCTESGVLRTYCSFKDCTSYQDTEIPALGHKLDNWIVTKEPTCTEPGEKVAYCRVCKEVAETLIIPAAGHNYSDWKVVKEATFTKDGLQERECSVCHDKLEAVIPKLSESHVHDYSGEQKVIKEPTCTEKGLVQIACSNEECTAVKEIELPEKGHSFGDWVTVREATADKQGEKERVCKVCGEKEKEAIEFVKADANSVNPKTDKATVQTGDTFSWMTIIYGIMVLLALFTIGIIIKRHRSF